MRAELKNWIRLSLCLLAGTPPVAGVFAQEPMPAAPLLTETARVAAGARFAAEGRADRALEAGFPATAAVIYRQILAQPGLPEGDRHRITLALVTVLLDAGETTEAAGLLRAYDGPRSGGYHLRTALLAAQGRQWLAVKAALADSGVESLPAVDRGWWHYLRALVADAENDVDLRRREFAAALDQTVSAAQRANFQMAQELVLLRVDQTSEAQLAVFRGNMEKFAGQPTGYEATRFYAAALSVAGQRTEAIGVLQRALAVMPPSEQRTADQFQLLIGYIAGVGSEQGRRAFGELVRRAVLPETQRTALYLLARGAATRALRELLSRDLTRLVSGPVEHPVMEDILLVRAELALADQRYAEAEEDARVLLERFPGSTLKAAALGVRLSVAWELRRYRTAADVIAQLRTLLPPGRERSELGVLLAESFFRSEDFRGAAAAYEAALREAPAVEPAGTLIFQRVLAEIRADQLEVAAALLDEAVSNPAFDVMSRWQAEWNLTKEMQVRGQTAGAYARVDRLLQGGAAGVPPELRVRLLWLRAKLSFDTGQTEETLRLVAGILAEVQGSAEISGPTKTIVAGNATLLKAEALFARERDEEGAATLERLRSEFGGTQSAIYSYVVQARRLAQRGELARAQEMLTRLADENSGSEFAPMALYEAALYAERQGLERNLQEANNLLDRINRDYAADGLRFAALKKQGDLLRKMNDFTAARQVYEFALNNYPQQSGALAMQLALADTLFALGAGSVSNRESAAAMFERLRDLASAPVDLRVEAGFKWGYALATRKLTAKQEGAAENGDVARAIAVYWSVVDGFLLDAEQAGRLGATGRYWMSRTLLELGQLHESRGNMPEAIRAYQLIVEQRLSGVGQANAKLERYRAPSGGPSR